MNARTGLPGKWAGTGKVFFFTLEQTFKSKAHIITLIIMVALSLTCVPLGSLMLGDTGDDLLSEDYIDEYTEDSDNYGDLSDEQLDYLKTLGISDAVIEALKNGNDGMSWDSVEEYEEYQSALQEEMPEEDEDDFSAATVFIQLVYAIMVMMLCLLATSYIIRSVLEEKTSKLVDLLMVSVKPLALLLGKILAMLVYVIFMILMMIAGAVVSYMIFGSLMDTSYLGNFSVETGTAGASLLILKMLFSMGVSAILGYIGFGFLAGVLGAGCNNMEESSNAMGVPMMLCMAGYFIALAVSFISNRAVLTVLSLVPVLNMYIAPVQYTMGHIGLPVLLLSWLIQILCAVFGLWLSSKVYQSLIINNGRQVKLRGILRMAVKGVDA